MKLGPKAMEALRSEVTGSLSAGEKLVVAGAVALRGTVLAVEREWVRLSQYFSRGFLEDCLKLEKYYGVHGEVLSGEALNLPFIRLCKAPGEETPLEMDSLPGIDSLPGADFLPETGSLSGETLLRGTDSLQTRIEKGCGDGEITAYYSMGEGGVLSALWKMAQVSGTGLSVDLRKIPIRQETVEICEYFDMNPYRLFSQGAVLLGAKNGRTLTEKLTRRGMIAEVIGEVREGNACLLRSGENVRYLERPGKDELWKVMDPSAMTAHSPGWK